MSFINTENFEPYADVIAPNCPENFSYIHDLLAEPVAKLEKKGYAVACVHVPAPFPTLHKENNLCTVPENPVSVPDHCRPLNESFQYTSDGDYRLFLIFEDHVRLPVYEPEQWHLHYRERELFTVIPSRLSTLDHYAVILERLRMLYAWMDSLPEHDGQESA